MFQQTRRFAGTREAARASKFFIIHPKKYSVFVQGRRKNGKHKTFSVFSFPQLFFFSFLVNAGVLIWGVQFHCHAFQTFIRKVGGGGQLLVMLCSCGGMAATCSAENTEIYYIASMSLHTSLCCDIQIKSRSVFKSFYVKYK